MEEKKKIEELLEQYGYEKEIPEEKEKSWLQMLVDFIKQKKAQYEKKFAKL